MSTSASQAAKTGNWNVPNFITSVRLVVSLLVFVAMHFEWYLPALILFVIAASTDWIDGYLARRWNQVTQLGRILDPLADKIVIAGTFIFLSAVPDESQIPAWMTVVVVAREFMVTVLRSFLEQQGQDFSAKMSGKLKMVFQCAAAVASLLLLCQLSGNGLSGNGAWTWLPRLVTVLAWIAVISTVYSGVVYIGVARKLLRKP